MGTVLKTNLKKDVPINLKAKPEQRALIDRAAQLLSKTRSEFILDVMCREAENVLLDQRLFIVSDEKYDNFVKMLEASLTETHDYQRLMSNKRAWK